MWEPLTATGERLFGPNATQRAEGERAQAWAHCINGGGGEIAHLDGYKWYEMVCRHIAEDEERSPQRSTNKGRSAWAISTCVTRP